MESHLQNLVGRRRRMETWTLLVRRRGGVEVL